MAIKLIKDFVDAGESTYVTPAPTYYFDQEAIKVSHPGLLPGHVYTFRALNPRGSDSVASLDDWQTGESKGIKPYYDNRPILLSLGKNGPLEIGLNLKLIPRIVRKKFIRNYLKRILPILDKLTDADGNFHEINTRIRMPAINPLLGINREFIRSASDISGINFEFLVDKYNREEMVNLSIIDWPDVISLSNADYSRDPAIATRTPISYFLTKFT